MNESVVITGIGMVSAAGIGYAAFRDKLRLGETGLTAGSLDRESDSLHLMKGSVVDDHLPDCIEPRRHLNFKHMSRSGAMVCAAAGLATKDAQYHPSESDLERTGIVMGTAFGGMQSMLRFNSDVRSKGPSAVNPIIFPDTVSNAPAGYAAIAFGMMGMNATLSTGFSSGFRAIRVAYEQVASGSLVTALAGGYDELIPDLCHYWQTSGKLSNAYSDEGLESNPFDSRRKGFYPGEAAVVFVLESRAAAEKRGAPIYAELAGFGACQSTDSSSTGSSMKETAIRKALKHAAVQPSEIGAVFASANGSVAGDYDEALAISNAMGSTTLVAATKNYTGECMAAGGPLALAAALYSLKEKMVPAIPFLTTDEGEMPIRLSKEASEMGSTTCCLINAFGLDAQGESLIVRSV